METNSIFSRKYLRLVYCLIETCSKSARRLLLFYLDKSRPVDLNQREWTIDEFLHDNRERLPKLNPSQRAILFPGFGIKTNIHEWDISILFIILEMFKLDVVITKDIMAIKKMRNKIFHAASTSINRIKYGEYKAKITVYIENCCDILGDQTLAIDIAHVFKEAEDIEMDAEERTHIMSDFDNWFKSDPLFECIDKFPSDIGLIMDVLFQQIVNLLINYRFKIPDAYLSLQISSCNPGISEVVSDQILKHLCDERSPHGDSDLGKAISGAKKALIDKQRQLVEKRKGCLILRIRSEDLEGFWCLISDCISGKLTSSWREVQNIVREEQGAPYLTIEVGVTASEIISCVEELVQNISEGIGYQLQKSLSTKHAIPDEQSPIHHTEGKEPSFRDKRDIDEKVRPRRSYRSRRAVVDGDFKRPFSRQWKGGLQDATTTYNCLQCPSTFECQEDLSTHVQKAHHRTCPIVCPWCLKRREREFRHPMDLVRHIQDKHPADYREFPRDTLSIANICFLSRCPSTYVDVHQVIPSFSSPSATFLMDRVKRWCRLRDRSVEPWQQGWDQFNASCLASRDSRKRKGDPFIDTTPLTPAKITVTVSPSPSETGSSAYSSSSDDDESVDDPPSTPVLRTPTPVSVEEGALNIQLTPLCSKSEVTTNDLLSMALDECDVPLSNFAHDLQLPVSAPQLDYLDCLSENPIPSSQPVHSTEISSSVILSSSSPSSVSSTVASSSIINESSVISTSVNLIPINMSSVILSSTCMSSVSSTMASSSVTESSITSTSVRLSPINMSSVSLSSMSVSSVSSSSFVSSYVNSSPVNTSTVRPSSASTLQSSTMSAFYQPSDVSPVSRPLMSLLTMPARVSQSRMSQLNTPSLFRPIPQPSLEPSSSPVETVVWPTTPETRDPGPKPSCQERARQLLLSGSFPLLPPGRRDWETVQDEAITLLPKLSWPPKCWRSMSPEQRQFVAEWMFITLHGRWEGQTRSELLFLFNHLVLPGTLQPRDSAYVRVLRANLKLVTEISKKPAGTETSNDLQILTAFEKGTPATYLSPVNDVPLLLG